jgi:hypothetical protein
MSTYFERIEIVLWRLFGELCGFGGVVRCVSRHGFRPHLHVHERTRSITIVSHQLYLRRPHEASLSGASSIGGRGAAPDWLDVQPNTIVTCISGNLMKVLHTASNSYLFIKTVNADQRYSRDITLKLYVNMAGVANDLYMFEYDEDVIQAPQTQVLVFGVASSDDLDRSCPTGLVGTSCLAGTLLISFDEPVFPSRAELASLIKGRVNTKTLGCLGKKSLVFCELNRWCWAKTLDDPRTPFAGNVLYAKICGALANMRYPRDVVEKVGKLVQKNMASGSSTGPVEPVTETCQALLQSLLDQKVDGSRQVSFNSNEPVLLINTSTELGHHLVGSVLRETLQHLQKKNIWPVRAYAGPFVPLDLMPGEAVSVTLLNVVNTEIGGPSMINLLDHQCDSPIWSFQEAGFHKEVWRDRQFIDRFDTGPASPRVDSPESEAVQSDQDVDSEDWDASPKSVAAIENEIDEIDEDIPFLEDVSEQRESENPTAPPQDSNPALDDKHSASADVRAGYDRSKEASAIAHPTWEHTIRGDSLLDLVTSQAAGIRDIGLNQPLPRSASSQKRKKEAGASDDEFVVV